MSLYTGSSCPKSIFSQSILQQCHKLQLSTHALAHHDIEVRCFKTSYRPAYCSADMVLDDCGAWSEELSAACLYKGTYTAVKAAQFALTSSAYASSPSHCMWMASRSGRVVFRSTLSCSCVPCTWLIVSSRAGSLGKKGQCTRSRASCLGVKICKAPSAVHSLLLN